MKVLIVDDQLVVRKLVSEHLARSGHQSVAVESAEQCLRRLEGDSYDLVISDIEMPGRSGLDLLSDIRSSIPDLPVILISGSNDPWHERRSAELGAGYLRKPFSQDALLRAMQAVLPEQRGNPV